MPWVVTTPLSGHRRCNSMKTQILFFSLYLLFFFSFLSPANSATAAEKEALLNFKSNLTGNSSNALSSWSISGDPCLSFTGITCSDNGDVIKILIHGAGLAGPLSPAIVGLRNLQILSLFGNRLVGPIPPEFSSLTSLKKLNLSTNQLSGEIPGFIGDLPSLRLLDLASNSFTGEIPPKLFSKCFRTRYVSLAHNLLSGSVPSNFDNCANLVGIDFSFNNLTGELSDQLCLPPGMNYLSVRSNSLSGTVLDKISGCRSLELLDLGSNAFTGLSPFSLLGLTNISYFNVSYNQFAGEISEFGSCGEKLATIDAAGNQLAGAIPASIGNCRALRVLSLASNELSGSIPVELSRIEMLQILDLQGVRISGRIPTELSNCQFLLELDLSNNELEGEIPDKLYNMTYLQLLDLHQNKLSGRIPPSIGNLTRIEYLDFSQNSLTGAIPQSLGYLAMMTHFNVSYNKLSGAIPSAPIIQSFGPSAFSHNAGLCGSPLDTPCSGSAAGGSRRSKYLSASVIVAIVAAALILAGVCLITAMNIRAYRRRRVSMRRDDDIVVSISTTPSNGSNVIIGKLVLFSKSLPSKYKDWEAGTKALLDKDCMIGGGSIGTVYKASLDGGIYIAVKKLETLGRIRNQEEFEQEMSRLGDLQHPNLVAFQGYYWSSQMQLILSEFISNGNLYQHLHGSRHSGTSTAGDRGELFWARRFNIALGVARALAYLHHDCRPQVLHLNIKSANILLDENYEGKLSDYGIGKLLPILQSNQFGKFHTTVGYVAPELASESMSFSDKSDVYSFGVVILEIVTGRKPVDSPGPSEVLVLRDYVTRMLADGRPSDCFDGRLRAFVEAELIQVLKLGLICTADDPSRRLNMAEVVQYLESIRSSL